MVCLLSINAPCSKQAAEARKQLEGVTESSTATERRVGATARTGGNRVSLIMDDGADTGSSTTDDDGGTRTAVPAAVPVVTPSVPPANETPQEARLRRMAERRARVEAKRLAAEAAKASGATTTATDDVTEDAAPKVSATELKIS